MTAARAAASMLLLAAGALYGRVRRRASEKRINDCETAIKYLSAVRKGVLNERKPLPDIVDEITGAFHAEDAKTVEKKRFSEICGEAGEMLDEALVSMREASWDEQSKLIGSAEERLNELLDREKNVLAPRARLEARLSVMAGAAAAILIL